MHALDISQYSAPAPVTDGDCSAWDRAAANARAQVEHQRTRTDNLGLLDVYGANAWAVHIKQLEGLHADLFKRLEATRIALRDLDTERKTEQARAGRKIDQLHTQWVAQVRKNAEIEQACHNLEARIAMLK
jgi:pre-mRNA-splicing factor SPF27